MCGILTRIDTLNRQLISISKLQEMEEEYMHHRPPCKKCSVQNNVGKYCRCMCHVFPLKEPCNRTNCSQECFAYDNKPRGYCDSRTCRARRKLLHPITSQLNEVQADARNDVQVVKSVSTYVNTNSQNSMRANEKHNKSDQVNFDPQLFKSHGHDKIISTLDKSREQIIPTRDFHTEVSVHSVHTVDANDKQVETSKEGTNKQLETSKKDGMTRQPETSNKDGMTRQPETSNKDGMTRQPETSKKDGMTNQLETSKKDGMTRQPETSNKEVILVTQGTHEPEVIINNGNNGNIGDIGNIRSVSSKDKNPLEQMQKDLINERERTKELEKQLKSLTCSFKCLKEDSEQKAACLKDALENAEGQYKTAVDLMKKSKNQSDLLKADRDELLSEIAKLQQQIIEVAHANTALKQERDDLKNKLASLSENESKRCEEIEKEVNKLKVAVKEKEDALNKERKEFMDMISELTNVIKIQKRRLCEVSGICNNQQRMLHEKDEDLARKNNELSDKEILLQTRDCVCKQLEEKIEDLKYCLCEETEACNCLRQEIEILKDNHCSNQRIKEKIVEEQNRTIAKQRKLLHDSEKVAQQAAVEFDQLKDEVYKEKEKNLSLQVQLDKTNNHMDEIYSLECEKCTELRREIDYLKEELYKEKEKNLSMRVALSETNNHMDDICPPECAECAKCTELRREIDYLKEELYKEKEKNLSMQVALSETNNRMDDICPSECAECAKCTELRREIDYLKEELYKEKEKNLSMQVALSETNNHMDDICSSECAECAKCTELRNDIDYLKQEKQRALVIAKFAYQKFHECVNHLSHQKQQQKYMTSIIEKKEDEIKRLKCQLCQNNFKTF